MLLPPWYDYRHKASTILHPSHVESQRQFCAFGTCYFFFGTLSRLICIVTSLFCLNPLTISTPLLAGRGGISRQPVTTIIISPRGPFHHKLRTRLPHWCTPLCLHWSWTILEPSPTCLRFWFLLLGLMMASATTLDHQRAALLWAPFLTFVMPEYPVSRIETLHNFYLLHERTTNALSLDGFALRTTQLITAMDNHGVCP